jgi:hypothetical protein
MEKADISTLEKTGHLYFAPTAENAAYFAYRPEILEQFQEAGRQMGSGQH